MFAFYRVCLSRDINKRFADIRNKIVFSDATTSFNLSSISDERQTQSGIQIDRHTQTHRLIYRYEQRHKQAQITRVIGSRNQTQK